MNGARVYKFREALATLTPVLVVVVVAELRAPI